jgi:uracil-DNA glycosylase
MMTTSSQHETWETHLAKEEEKPYFKDLQAFLAAEKQQGACVYPETNNWYQALKLTPFANTKVVILGQDPYHGPKQAHGLCFSVPQEVPPPPSLKNIFKELNRDLALPIPQHGDLSHWSTQGVLLLNTVLTVRAHQAGSHTGKGWEQFTDTIIKTLNEHKEFLVFLLWGRFAINKQSLIDTQKHTVLTTTHPSPLSAYRGFLGCSHFSKTNQWLKKKGKEPIKWCKTPAEYTQQ